MTGPCMQAKLQSNEIIDCLLVCTMLDCDNDLNQTHNGICDVHCFKMSAGFPLKRLVSIHINTE